MKHLKARVLSKETPIAGKTPSAHGSKVSKFWDSLSAEQQNNYLKMHPDSKFKDFPKKKTSGDKSKSTELAPKKVPEAERPKAKLSDVIKDWHKEQKEFFNSGQHHPESKERAKLADLVTRKSSGLKKSIQGEVKEWRVAAGALRKMKNGEPLDKHDRGALKAIALHSGIVIGDLAVTGGLATGVAQSLSAVFGGMLSHSLAVNFGKAAVYAAMKTDKKNQQTDDELLDELIQHLAHGVKSAPIVPEHWVNAIEKVNKHAKPKKK